MYDWIELRDATDAFWQGLARHLKGLPPIDRRDDFASAWRNPDLLFSQTCGYPFTHAFRGKLNYVATPHYAADGCDGPNYCSIVFARQHRPLSEFRGTTAAVNNPDSMSGMLALKLVFAPLAREGKFFAAATETGSHVQSMIAVREGKAAVCANDSVCVAYARRYRPDLLEGLVEIARSPSVPGLPFVTRGGDTDVIRSALRGFFADPQTVAARDALLMSGMSVLDAKVYDRILDLETAMESQGGLALI